MKNLNIVKERQALLQHLVEVQGAERSTRDHQRDHIGIEPQKLRRPGPLSCFAI